MADGSSRSRRRRSGNRALHHVFLWLLLASTAAFAVYWYRRLPRTQHETDSSFLMALASIEEAGSTAQLARDLERALEHHVDQHAALGFDRFLHDDDPDFGPTTSPPIPHIADRHSVLFRLVAMPESVSATDIMQSLEFNPRAVAVSTEADDVLRRIVCLYTATIPEMRNRSAEILDQELAAMRASGVLQRFDPFESDPDLAHWCSAEVERLMRPGRTLQQARAEVYRLVSQLSVPPEFRLVFTATSGQGRHVMMKKYLPRTSQADHAMAYLVTNYVATVSGWAMAFGLIGSNEHASIISAMVR